MIAHALLFEATMHGLSPYSEPIGGLFDDGFILLISG
jgi:hypothetical protein